MLITAFNWETLVNNHAPFLYFKISPSTYSTSYLLIQAGSYLYPDILLFFQVISLEH